MSVRDLIPWGRERSPSVRGGEVMDPILLSWPLETGQIA